jgi:hypothetical protein
MDELPTFPDELYMVEQEVEGCSHMGHPDLVEAAVQCDRMGFIQKYRKVGKPMQVDMENRQQHRVTDGEGKAITPWITWEGGGGPCSDQ